eukprot:m.100504 g.100504  ORF g.100504 m.100504 type:complete len:387 (-) comp12553_c0_seq12:1031-2191(-)
MFVCFPFYHLTHTFRQSLGNKNKIHRLRAHASILVFLYGSDESPPLNVEQLYIDVFDDEHWQLPILSSAANTTTQLQGRTGVKMDGPYAWVPPAYWYDGMSHAYSGGAFGFSTEISPGASPTTLTSAREMLTDEHLWPIDSVWDFHCGSELGLFHDLRFFLPPLHSRMPACADVKSFLYFSQLMAYESHSAMFEAYSVFKYTNATGVIQWMLNNPFPSMIWHLIDFFGRVGGSFYGVKSILGGNVNVVIARGAERGGELFVVNNNPLKAINAFDCILQVEIWSMESTVTKVVDIPLDGKIEPDSSVKIGTIQPDLKSICSHQSKDSVYLVRAMLKDLKSNSTLVCGISMQFIVCFIFSRRLLTNMLVMLEREVYFTPLFPRYLGLG